jgi:hypothetical protein
MCLVVAGSLVGCNDTMGIFPTPEDLAVTVITRNPIQGETIPLVRILPGMTTVTVIVARPGLCGTQVEASLSRAPGDLVILARVSADPLAFCAGVVTVATYTGVISDLPAGPHRVRVFEAQEMGSPQLIGSAVVSVAAGEGNL